MNKIVKIILLVLIALVIGQGLVLYKQGQQRYPVAGKIIEEKINELTNQVGYAGW